MNNFNPENERIKREYFEYLKEAYQKSSSTIDNIKKSIARYEKFTEYKNFKSFNKEKAIVFKNNLLQTKAKQTGNTLSESTVLTTCRNLKSFFLWLRNQSGYKSKLNTDTIDFLNLPESYVRIATSIKVKEFPTIEQIKKVIYSMPDKTDIDKRNKALISFTLLSGLRDSAIASLKLKHIDIEKERIEQDPAEVKTKFSKLIYTFFFPVGDDIKKIFIDWINYLYKNKLFDNNAPVFPKTKLTQDKNQMFIADGLESAHWELANQIRDIFKNAFESAGLKYYSPHSFRNTLVNLGEKMCNTPEEFKAWSQNLGHEHVMTTFYSYGTVLTHRQGELIKNLSQQKIENKDTSELLNEIKKLNKNLENKNQ